MITVNRMGDSICGSINSEQFGVPYNEATYNAMLDLQTSADTAESVEELKTIVEEFKQLTEVDYNTTIQSECKDIFYNEGKGSYHLKVKNDISSVPMPKELVEKLLASIDKGIDSEPLIKLWIRWLRNPILKKKNAEDASNDFSKRMFSYIDADFVNEDVAFSLVADQGLSEEIAKERATVKQVGITVEGLIKTYKVSTELTKKYSLDEDGNEIEVDRIDTTKKIDPDTGLITYDVSDHTNEDRLFEPAVLGKGGDAFFCGDVEGHFIRVGQRHYLSDWSKVNTNDKTSCVKGLHCGGLDYIKGYQYGRTETHNILVDPMHIGAIPNDDTGAMRVKEYFVLDAFSGVNGSIYHSSTYAKQTDDQWKEMKKQILKDFGKLTTDIESDVAEMINL